MKNYISLNGKKIELTSEQIAEMTKSLGIKQIKLSDIPIGKTFKVDDYEFVVLEHSKDTTAVILKNLLYTDKKFGSDNDYKGSNVDSICCDFGEVVKKIVGCSNLIKHTVDLTSDDGLKDYGKIHRYASLLTAGLYRRYVEILDNHKVDKWWWLATAYSTPTHGDSSFAKCVAPSGSIINYNDNDNGGVRPFCILNSNIFVSQ